MPDSAARREALDPRASFIVQAPAGSGKTELLTQRFLALLSVVDIPEEILAITFTNKAAAEMKARIVLRLQEKPHLDRWDILKNPNRLRVVTIDAFSRYLSGRLPLLSNFGCQPDILDEPRFLYQQAAEALLQTLEQDVPWADALQSILSHLDNRFDSAQNLFENLLSKRDQWLSVIHRVDSELSLPLQRMVEELLQQVHARITPEQSVQLLNLIQHAFDHAPDDSELRAYPRLDHFPDPIAEKLPLWQAISVFLTTQEGGFRKTVNKNLGFIAKTHQVQKDAMMDLLSELMQLYEPQLFAQIKDLPNPDYSPIQKKIIEDIVKILPALVAQLKVIFKTCGQVDFIEVAEGASRALGALDDPSDLALRLDYQIKHILIDEFQDTSVAQYHFFERLVAGWQPGEERSLFLVGDPMQSIYHFRGAEVGLFIKARSEGLGNVLLKPLYLTQNFRSHPVLVNTFNQLFLNLFPREDNLSLGAVKFHKAVSAVNDTSNNPLNVFLIQGLKSIESHYLMEHIRAIQAKHPDYRIGVLSRTKQQLNDLLSVLSSEKIPFQGEQLEPLSDQQLILDLKALTLAMLDLTDHLAWFAILRAPWCGLTLHDLYIIKTSESGTIWATLQDQTVIRLLSEDGQVRLSKLLPLMSEWLSQKGRVSLRNWIQGLWMRFGGPACLRHLKEESIADAFFELLESMDEGGVIQDRSLWEEKLSKLYLEDITAEKNASNLTLMTIHKAKGLEFDVVFLVGAEDAAGIDDSPLFLWFERPWARGVDLLFAPKAEIGESDKLYEYIRQQIKAKKNLEQIRLLYVAMTRARKALYVCARIEDEERPSSKGSFLSHLRPLFESVEIVKRETQTVRAESAVIPCLKRLNTDWMFPIQIKSKLAEKDSDLNHPENLGAPLSDLRHVGTLVHQIFQMIADEGRHRWKTVHPETFQMAWQSALLAMGVTPDRLNYCLDLVKMAVQHFLTDQQIDWIFSAENQSVHNEWALCDVRLQRVQTHVLDRTFIDKAGTRWIIDYKIIDKSQDKFHLEKVVETYIPQLNRYRKLLSNLEGRPTRCGLYFPVEKILWLD
ncbi:MAG: UvrD-helicase domain-containing protein [Gammaproteobacteria bacterium]